MSYKVTPDPIIVVFDFDETIAHFDDENVLAGPHQSRTAEPLLYVRREIFYFLHELRAWWGRTESLVVIWSRGDDCYIQEAVCAINGLASHIDIVWGESKCQKSLDKFGVHKSVDYVLQHKLVIQWLTEVQKRRHMARSGHTSYDRDAYPFIVPTTVIIDDKAEENSVGQGNLYHYTWTVKPISQHEIELSRTSGAQSGRQKAGDTRLVLLPIVCDLIACLCWQQTCNPLMTPILIMDPEDANVAPNTFRRDGLLEEMGNSISSTAVSNVYRATPHVQPGTHIKRNALRLAYELGPMYDCQPQKLVSTSH